MNFPLRACLTNLSAYTSEQAANASTISEMEVVHARRFAAASQEMLNRSLCHHRRA